MPLASKGANGLPARQVDPPPRPMFSAFGFGTAGLWIVDKLEILLFAQQMHFQNLHTQSHSPSLKKKKPIHI